MPDFARSLCRLPGRHPQVRVDANNDEATSRKGDPYWQSLLKRFHDHFGATIAGLFWHIWYDKNWGGGEIFEAVPDDSPFITAYKEYSGGNPWLPDLLSKPEGFFIVGGNLNIHDRMRRLPLSKKFVDNVMIPNNAIRGMGASLFKKRLVGATLVVAIAIVRPGDGTTREGEYTPEEQAHFERYLPEMREKIRHHRIFREHDEFKLFAPGEDKTVEQRPETAQNGNIVHLRNLLSDPPVKPPTIFESTDDFLARQGVPEHDRPETAAPIVQLIESYRRNPAVAKACAKAMLAAVTVVQATGAASPETGHAQRITRSRRPSAVPDEPSALTNAPPPIPATWEEATSHVRDLLKWEQAKAAAQTAKREGRRTGRFSIIDHLKDVEHGYGRWTLQEPGLPRTALLAIGDNGSHEALTSWLSRDGNELPPDLHVPTISQWTDILAAKANNPCELPYRVAMALAQRGRRSLIEK